MKKLIIGIISLTFTFTLNAQDVPKDCDIYLCMPSGFPSGCSDSKKRFEKRIEHGKSPLPSPSSCFVGDDGKDTSNVGYNVQEIAVFKFPKKNAFDTPLSTGNYGSTLAKELDKANETFKYKPIQTIDEAVKHSWKWKRRWTGIGDGKRAVYDFISTTYDNFSFNHYEKYANTNLYETKNVVMGNNSKIIRELCSTSNTKKDKPKYFYLVPYCMRLERAIVIYDENGALGEPYIY